MAKVLSLKDPGVQAVMRDPLLKGKKMIGRGMFAAVFEGCRPNTVIKLTADSAGYWLLNDGCMRVKHWHFPRVKENFGDVGEISIGKEKFPLFMFELERLERARGEARKLAKFVSEKEGRTHCCGYNTVEKLAILSDDRRLPRSTRNAMKEMQQFCSNYDNVALDMHLGNFMQRPNGELVMSDPVMDMVPYRARFPL